MTAIAPRDTTNGVVPATAPPVFDAGSTAANLEQLAAWVTAAHNAHALVAPLVQTPFVPESYRPKVDPRATPEEKAWANQVAVATGTAAVLQGLSLGLDPLTSLQQIYVVHGRPGMYAKIKVALVTARGHEVWTEDLTDARAVVCGRRKGSQHLERVTITMDQARRAGWAKNDTYAKTPQDMLWARAAGRVCDRIAPDVLMGIRSVEEADDDDQTATEAPRSRTAVRRAAQPERANPAAPARAAIAQHNDGDVGAVYGRHPVPLGAEVEPVRHAGPPLPGEWEEAPPPASPPAGAESGDQGPTDEPDGDEANPPTVSEATDKPPAPVSRKQMAALQAGFTDIGVTDRQKRLQIVSGLINRPVTSANDLNEFEASWVLDRLNIARMESDPVDWLIADPTDPVGAEIVDETRVDPDTAELLPEPPT